jgi:hypothetical protein
MTALTALEQAFQGYVREREGEMPSHVVGTARAGARQRLAVYADAYRLRLTEVLGNDYPALRALAGAERFSALGEAYLAARPSRNFNARDFGNGFAAFLESQDSALAELARLEWAMATVFDHADEPVADVAAAAAIAPERWGAMQVVTQAAQRLLALSFNTGEIRQASDKGLALPPVRRHAAPEHWLVWRQDFEVYYRALAPDEAAALSAAHAGRSFAEICETLSPGEDTPLRAAGLLRRWLEDGLVARLEG